MPGVNYYDGSQWSEVAAVQQDDGATAPIYRYDGSEWVQVYPSTGGEVDLFAVAGQSNAVGRGDGSQSPDPTQDEALEYINSSDSIENPLDDPVEGNSDSANTGSAWPKFCVDYFAQTSRVPAIVGTAQGDSGQTSESEPNNWDTSGSLQGDAVTFINNAISKLESAGYTVDFKGILWHQGESDATSIDDGTITKSDYKSALETMISDFRSDLNEPSMPFWIFQLGKPESGDTAGYQDVRDAQAEVVSENTRVYMASDIQVNFADDGRMSDDVHYNQTGYNDMGDEGASNVASALETPTISNYTASSSTTDDTAPTISNYTASSSTTDDTAPTISNYSAT